MQLLSLLRVFRPGSGRGDQVETSWRFSHPVSATAEPQEAQSFMYHTRNVSHSICLLSLDGRSMLLQAESVPATKEETLSEEDMRLRVELKDWLQAMEFIENASDGEVTALLDPPLPPETTLDDFDPRELQGQSEDTFAQLSHSSGTEPSSPTFIDAARHHRRSTTLPPAASQLIRREVSRLTALNRFSWFARNRRKSTSSSFVGGVDTTEDGVLVSAPVGRTEDDSQVTVQVGLAEGQV
ncbi:hypothetical protein PUNSTDRAFT_49598, partial [Punctularia strigosozonata HHB-11173 SS5]|uniref:uncharacterized protein n=1 Tax=Punctularia strigosozonata (strain HHB-11173) TaxID=741275 RepID=UPI00044166A5